jgi:hypothetical protein
MMKNNDGLKRWANHAFIFDDINIILTKVIVSINVHREAAELYKDYAHDNRDTVTPTGINNAVSNHLLDDNPEKFGISKLEGHAVRAWVQTYFEVNKEILQKFLNGKAV